MSKDWTIWRIARSLSEATDPLEDYHDKWKSKTVLSDDTYYQVIGILKKVCEENGCVFDHRKLAVEFIPPGFIIKNVWIDCPDPQKKKALVQHLAQQTGDETIKHTFDDNLRVNLYNALNRSFGNRVREELNLEVTHQFRALPPGSDDTDRSEVLPMITITTPMVDTELEGDEFEDEGSMEPLPLEGPPGGPEKPPGPGREGELGASPTEESETAIQLPGFEEEEGEEPMGGPEEELPPPRGKEEDLVSFESIQRIANLTDEFLV